MLEACIWWVWWWGRTLGLGLSRGDSQTSMAHPLLAGTWAMYAWCVARATTHLVCTWCAPGMLGEGRH